MGALLSRRRYMGGKALPYDAEIEWLGTAEEDYDTYKRSGQYIDTGLYGSLDLDFEITFMFTRLRNKDRDNEGSVFGGRSEWNSKIFQLSTYSRDTNSLGHFAYANYGWNNGYAPTLKLSANNILTVKKEGRSFTNAAGNMTTLQNTSFQCVYQIYLFCLHSANDGEFAKYLRLYSAKFSRNGVLLRDYIPVRVGTTGYLYERVNKTLCGNEGTGDFILGPDKT